MYFTPAAFFVNQFRQLPGVFMTPQEVNTPGSLDSLVENTPGSRLQIQITLRTFEKIRNPFYACLMGLGEVV